MIKPALVRSAENTFINNNFRNEISTVDDEVDVLAAKLEKDDSLSRLMMSICSCDCKMNNT